MQIYFNAYVFSYKNFFLEEFKVHKVIQENVQFP